MTTAEESWRAPVPVRWVCALLPVLTVAYGLTLVPGVRGPGPMLVPWLEIGVGDGLIVVSGLLCVARAVRVAHARLAWLLLGLAPLLYVVGDLVYYAFFQALTDPPYPSWADLCWLAVYPLLSVGLLLLVAASLRGARLTLWLDGLTGGFGAAALLGVAVLKPVLSLTGGPVAQVATNLAYPVGDLTLLVVVTLVFNLHGWRPPRVWWPLAWVAVVLLAADSAYLLQVGADTYVDGGPLDVGWTLAYVALGPAAWWRTPTEAGTARGGRAGLLIPAGLSILSTMVLFVGALDSLPLLVAGPALAAVLTATVRLMLALAETWRLVVARMEARTDELTGLPNRRRFLELVGESLGRPEPTAVMIVDLDRFKQVNDSLGHAVGDTLLKVLGRRLESRIGTADCVVARLGGDEFAVVLTGHDEPGVAMIANRLRDTVCEPVELAGLTLSVDASVGIAYATDPGTTWGTLLGWADAAMYVAKRARTGVECYDERRDETGTDRLALLGQLRDALRSQALEVHYQPVQSLADGATTSAEALVRWRHPQLGLMSPADFLPVAIEAGLSRDLTDEVLRLVTEQSARWRADGYELPVAVNLFEADLGDLELPARIAGACDRVGLPARLLQLEVTESIAVSVMTAAVPTLRELRRRGHELLLDDFGTGYSSLATLRDLPLDVIKLDRSFFDDLARPASRTIVHATVEMAHGLGLRIVAEGVETEEVLETVRFLGCDAAQGYHVQRPVPAADLAPALRSVQGSPSGTAVG
ncbi:MAG: bifunctional diguanylate cyclase/phosphodiesterase [Nocardioidaceae bacterium]